MINSLLTNLINQGLAFDPNTRASLKPLINQCLQITLQTPDSIYNNYLIFLIEGIEIIMAPAQTPNRIIQASITGSVGSFLALLLSQNPRFAITHGLSITGDFQTLLLFEQWLDTIHIDWAELISKVIGDNTAHILEKTYRRNAKKTPQFCKDWLQNIVDYLTDDQPYLIPRPLAECFYNKVDKLWLDIDRLTIQIKQSFEQKDPQTF